RLVRQQSRDSGVGEQTMANSMDLRFTGLSSDPSAPVQNGGEDFGGGGGEAVMLVLTFKGGGVEGLEARWQDFEDSLLERSQVSVFNKRYIEDLWRLTLKGDGGGRGLKGKRQT
ncbi:hypothetical protein HWV62_40989, partial [Athelia sp. TMB]